MTGDEYYEGSKDAYEDVQGLNEWSNSHIIQLRYGDAKSERVQVMEI